jgi:hypothetical protein
MSLNCYISGRKAVSWTTLEEHHIFTWGPVPTPVKLSVLLSLSNKTCVIHLVHFGAGNKKLCNPLLKSMTVCY